MKRGLFTLVVLGLLIGGAICGLAAPSILSDDERQQIIEIDGKFFLIHTVARGESLYGISKRYSISLGEIAKYNPDVYYGIKVGDTLRIPTRTPKKAEQTGELQLHVVQEGETLYSLARRYGVTLSELRSYNRLSSDELLQHTTLRIPKRGQGEQKEEVGVLDKDGVWHVVRSGETLYMLAIQYDISVDLIKQRNNLTSDLLSAGQRLLIPSRRAIKVDTCVARHVAKRGESLYRIAKEYGVTQQDLQRANPQLASQGLQVDDELCIPRKVVRQDGGSAAEPNRENAPEGQVVEVAPIIYCDSVNGYPRGRTLRCALMLPFSLGVSADDSLKLPAAVRQALPAGQTVSYDARFLAFYKGTLLAFEQFKRSGYNLALNVFDTRNDEARVRRIVASDTLRSADIIIGPVYPQNITMVSEYASSRRITMVSPLSGATPSFELNPFLFQANPSYRTQLRQMANSVELSDSTNVVLVREEASGTESAGGALHLMLESRIASLADKAGVRYSVVDCSPADASATISRQIERHMVQDRRNIVIVASNSEPLVSALLGQLAGVMRVGNYRVEVYGMPQWLKMSKLDFGQLLALNAHVFSPYYVDYENSRVCDFVRRYRGAYLEEPTQFAFQGYDIAVYFLRAIFKFGVDFRYCIDKVEHWQLQNTFNFKQSHDFSTYESEGVFMLRFDKARGLVNESQP